MATTTTITKMLFRRGNDEDRQQTILASGEPGWVLDTKRLWVGDGSTSGGYPIPAVGAENASAGKHLWYVDYELSYNMENKAEVPIQGLGQQFLDVNIPGVAKTFAGKEVFPITNKWFHPARDDITTNYNLIFDNQADGRMDSEIRHTGNGELKIWSSGGGNVNINNQLFVRGDGVIQFKADQFIVSAEKQIFDEGEMTHFEDKSIDFNVQREITGTDSEGKPIYKELTEGVDGVPADKTGIYFAHENWLSAGHVTVGHKPDYEGWGTIELAPPVYIWDWEEMGDSTGKTVTGRTGDGAKTDNWRCNVSEPESVTGWHAFSAKSVGEASGRDTEFGDWKAKPLIFHSLRPSSLTNQYDGYAHIMLESGLIVYDDAGKEIPGEERALGYGAPYNAYKINQSLDTRAIPVFSGLKIRSVDGTDGEPFDVRSGGTGVNNFSTGSVIHTIGKPDGSTTTSPLTSLQLDHGELTVGTQDGIVAYKPTGSKYIDVRSNVTNHPLVIHNTFAPDYLSADDALRTTWFKRWSALGHDDSTDGSGDVKPEGSATEPADRLQFTGDRSYHPQNNQAVIDHGHVYVSGSNTTGAKGLKFQHYPVAQQIYTHVGYNSSAEKSKDDTLEYFYDEDTKLKTRSRMFYAGDTDTNLEDIDKTFISVSAGNVDEYTPADFKEKGYALGGLKINKQGHVTGFRSKDFDYRYMQVFNVGTNPRKETRLLAPSDYAELTNSNEKGIDYTESILGYTLDNGAQPGELLWLWDYYNAWATSTDKPSTGVWLSTTELTNRLTGLKNIGHGRSSADYSNPTGENFQQMRVITGLQFNDYGTVFDYDTHDLSDVYYDKQQVSWLTTYLDTKIDSVSAGVMDIDYFSRWEDSATVDVDGQGSPVTISSMWRNNSRIQFAGGGQTTGSYIRVDDTQDAEDPVWQFVALTKDQKNKDGSSAGNPHRVEMELNPGKTKGIKFMATDSAAQMFDVYHTNTQKGEGDDAVTLTETNMVVRSSIVGSNHPTFEVIDDGLNSITNVNIYRQPVDNDEKLDPLQTRMFTFDSAGLKADANGFGSKYKGVNFYGTATHAKHVWLKQLGDENEADDDDTFSLVLTQDTVSKKTDTRNDDTSQLLYTHGSGDTADNSTSGVMSARLKYSPKTELLELPRVKVYTQTSDSDDDKYSGQTAFEVTGNTVLGDKVAVETDGSDGNVAKNPGDSTVIKGALDVYCRNTKGSTFHGHVKLEDTTGTKSKLSTTLADVNELDITDSGSIDVASNANVNLKGRTKMGMLYTDNSTDGKVLATDTLHGKDAKGKLVIGGTNGPAVGNITTNTTDQSSDYITVTNNDNEIVLSLATAWTTDPSVTAAVTTGNGCSSLLNAITVNNRGQVESVGTTTIDREALSLDEGNQVKFLNLTVGDASIGKTSETGEIRAAGDIVGFYSSSDERLKTDVETIDDALDIVNNLRGVRFKYDQDKVAPNIDTDRQRIGVIAQEVEQHLPEVVETDILPYDYVPTDEQPAQDDMYKRVRYENMTAVLIEAVKTLSARVEELENQLKG